MEAFISSIGSILSIVLLIVLGYILKEKIGLVIALVEIYLN